MVNSYFHDAMSEVDPDQVDWSYDERHASLVLTMKGKGKVDWDGNDSDGHRLTLIGAGFYPPDKLERPKDQDQNAAWAVPYPKFKCSVTTVHLPAAGKGFHWTYSSKPMNRRLAGVAYWRTAGLQNNIVRTVMSSQSFEREIPASEAPAINAQIPSFDNAMSTVQESASATPVSAPLPFTDEPDWAANPAVCSAPAETATAAK
jgi:hypothetical protein